MKKLIFISCSVISGAVIFCTQCLAENKTTNNNDPSACYVYNIDELLNWEYNWEGNLPAPSSMTCDVCCVNAGTDKTITTCSSVNSVVLGTSIANLCVGACSGSYCPTTFSWTPNDGRLSCYNCPQPTFTIGCPRYGANITYTLTVSHTSGCNGGCAQTTDQVKVTWSTCTGCDDRIGNFPEEQEVENSKINVYPTPGSGKITVQFETNLNGALLQVYNLKGEMVTEMPVTDSTMEVDLSKSAKGVYYIQVVKGDIPVMNKKVIISE